MCYLVTGINAARADTGGRAHTIYDTIEDARTQAETYLKAGYIEVTVWKQIGVPKLETKVSWEDSSCVE